MECHGSIQFIWMCLVTILKVLEEQINNVVVFTLSGNINWCVPLIIELLGGSFFQENFGGLNITMESSPVKGCHTYNCVWFINICTLSDEDFDTL